MKLVSLLLLGVCALAPLADAQVSVSLLPAPKLQFFDANGYPLAGGLIYTCTAGATCPGTPLATYTDSTGSTANANPVVLDAGGFASIWGGSAKYKIVVESSAGVVLYSQDNVSGTSLALSAPTVNAPDYNFAAQFPGGSLTAGTPATVTLTPCPAGVNGPDSQHYLYVSGGSGAAESVLITGGSCLSKAASGTITFQPANTHSGAWSIASASNGAEEAFSANAAGAKVVQPAGTAPDPGTLTVPLTGTLFDYRRLPAVFGSSAMIDEYHRTGAYNLRDLGGIWSQTAHFGLGTSLDMPAATGATIAFGSMFAARGNDVNTTPVGLGAVGVATAHGEQAFGANIIVGTNPGINDAALVGMEIDIEPPLGAVGAGVGSGGLYLNAFNVALPGPAIQFGGIGGGTFANGIGCAGVATTGTCLFGLGTIGSLINTGSATYPSGSAIILSNTHNIMFKSTTGSNGYIYMANNNAFRFVAGNDGYVHIRAAADGGPGPIDVSTVNLEADGTGPNKCVMRSGTGSPNGAVVGNVCDLYLNVSGGAGSTLYVKETGAATNTGWTAK